MKRLWLLLLLFAAQMVFAAATDTQPLRPVFQGSKTISCGTSSTATDVSALISGFLNDIQLELQNGGSANVFLETGSSLATAAVATGYPVLPSQAKVITVGPRITHVACISASGTQTVYVTVGSGN